MAIQIQFRRGTAAEWESVNPILAEGEMGIETDTNLFKIGNGINQWNDLEYGGLRGYSGSVGFAGSVGNMAVANVLYVSKSGNDLNSGTAINLSKLTIKSALQVATNGTTIFVKSGDYTEDNPLYVPEGVAIVGDNLRTTTVRPLNVTEDLFWVNNGVYLAHMTFKDHERPSSAVAFPPDGSAGVIHTSPYVQNCTSMTTTGTGMRVDGAHVKGLKSMVVDAYTQYNQGGIGIHHLNRGNSQLVSVFTICCDVAFLCESGGFCSITNSNSSFGNYALKSTGVSETLYSGKVKGTGSGFVFEIDNLINRPNIGDAVKFEGDPNYYTVSSATAITSGNVAIQKANFALATPDARNIRASILDEKDKIQVDTIDFLNETYPSFDFDQFKCSRDVGIIIESVIEDMLFGTNYRSRLAGISYYRVSASKVIGEQRVETIAAVNFVKNKVLTLIENDSTQGPEYEAIRQNFDSVIAIMSDSDGTSIAPALSLPGIDGIDPNKIKAKDILQANRQYIIEEGIAYIAETFPLLGYDRATCERDIGLIIDAVGYDLMFGSNFRSITAGRSYYREGAAVVTASQKEATIGAFTYLKTLIRNTVTDDSTVENALAGKVDIIIDILDQGLTAVPPKVFPAPTGYDLGFENARNLIEANREFIKEETIQYIKDNFPEIGYDRETCERDVGLIVDAISYDILFGSNFRTITAAKSYYREGAAVVTANQKEATVGAFTFLKQELLDLVVGNFSAEVSVTGNMDTIIGVLENGLSAVPTAIVPSPSNYDLGFQNARNLIESNRSFIKAEVVAFIADNYPMLGYDRATCERDVGLIIDAIGYDLMFGSNFRSITAGRSYYRDGAALVTADQKTATLAAFTELKAQIASRLSDNATALASANANMDLIIEILDDGLGAVPGFVIPEPTNYNAGLKNARDLISANRSFIKEEVIEFITVNYPSIVYDQNTCRRDIDLILDALYYDLTYGGNLETLIAGNAYYSFNVLQIDPNDKTATVNAYNNLKILVEQIAQNIDVSELQNSVAQVTGTAGSLAAATAAAQLIENIKIIINDQTQPSKVFPSTAWVTPTLVTKHNLLQSQKVTIQTAITNFVEENYAYVTAACLRDIDLILDALYYDLTYGGNLETIIAGRAYYSYSNLQIPAGEKAATLAAYAFMRDLIGDIAQNVNVSELQNTVSQITGDAGSSQAAAAAENLIDLIRTIIDTGTLGTEVAPSTSWVSQPLINSFNILQLQRNTLQESVGDFVDATYFYMPKCKRDIDLILDAMYYDLTYGGNMETLIAARAYYSYNVLQIPTAEKTATLAAYAFMRDLISDVTQNTDVTELQVVIAQVTGLAGSSQAATAAEALVEVIRTTIDTGTAPAEVLASTDWVAQNLVENHQDLQSAKSTIQSSVTVYIEENFAYKRSTCARDIGLIVDAVCYDLMYEGNSQTADAADEYFSGGVLQIPADQREATAMTFDYIKSIADDCILNNAITSLNDQVAQNTSLPAATSAEVTVVDGLFSIVSGLVRDAYTSTIVVEENVIGPIPDNATVTFHQFSLITSSGHTFEWVGAGTNVNAALPYLGGIPLSENQVIEENNGKVYFTGTDQQGDFRIGNDFVINRNTGTVTGRTFTKSLFAVMTPYILAIGE